MRDSSECDLCRNGVATTPEAVRAFLGEWGLRPEGLAHLGLLRGHVERHLGPSDGAIVTGGPGSGPTLLLAFRSRKWRPFTALVTCGVSGTRMCPPEGAPDSYRRVEFAILLPPDFDLSREARESNHKAWPLYLLHDLASWVRDDKPFVWCNHTFEKGDGPLASGSPFRGILFSHSTVIGEDFNDLPLENGDLVHFLTVWPLFRDELRYATRCGSGSLLRRLVMAGVRDIVDPKRKSIFGGSPGR